MPIQLKSGDGNPLIISGGPDDGLPMLDCCCEVPCAVDCSMCAQNILIELSGTPSSDGIGSVGKTDCIWDSVGFKPDSWNSMSIVCADGVWTLTIDTVADGIFIFTLPNSSGCPPYGAWTPAGGGIVDVSNADICCNDFYLNTSSNDIPAQDFDADNGALLPLFDRMGTAVLNVWSTGDIQYQLPGKTPPTNDPAIWSSNYGLFPGINPQAGFQLTFDGAGAGGSGWYINIRMTRSPSGNAQDAFYALMFKPGILSDGPLGVYSQYHVFPPGTLVTLHPGTMTMVSCP